jgi:hypothetical protein
MQQRKKVGLKKLKAICLFGTVSQHPQSVRLNRVAKPSPSHGPLVASHGPPWHPCPDTIPPQRVANMKLSNDEQIFWS